MPQLEKAEETHAIAPTASEHPMEAGSEKAIESAKAVTATPTTAASELSGILAQDVSGTQVAFALVAVAGGGAAWKFYRQRSKESHEEKMARLEAKKSEKKDDHGSCKVARAALEARVSAAEEKSAALEKKLATLEKRSSSFDDIDFDPEELTERLEKLEKRLKALSTQEKKEETQE